jgi:hypothetical protein
MPLADKYLPTPQSWHVAGEKAPVCDEYLPAGQDSHMLANPIPVRIENLPAEQGKQLSMVMAACSEYLPATHLMQVEALKAPAESDHVPLGHP